MNPVTKPESNFSITLLYILGTPHLVGIGMFLDFIADIDTVNERFYTGNGRENDG